jgi:hypothetical protein
VHAVRAYRKSGSITSLTLSWGTGWKCAIKFTRIRPAKAPSLRTELEVAWEYVFSEFLLLFPYIFTTYTQTNTLHTRTHTVLCLYWWMLVAGCANSVAVQPFTASTQDSKIRNLTLQFVTSHTNKYLKNISLRPTSCAMHSVHMWFDFAEVKHEICTISESILETHTV